MKKQFNLVRVATKNIVLDSFQGIRNIFGLRLRGYEGMIKKHLDELIVEMNLTYKNVLWHRISINPLAKGSVMIIIYGEYDE